MEIVLTLLFQANHPLKHWVDTFLIVIFLMNRMPYITFNMEILFSKSFISNPNYDSLRIFRCMCFLYLWDYGKNKFFKKYPCIFLGYGPTHKGYTCLDPFSRLIVFDKNVFPCALYKELSFQENLEVTTSHILMNGRKRKQVVALWFRRKIESSNINQGNGAQIQKGILALSTMKMFKTLQKRH